VTFTGTTRLEATNRKTYTWLRAVEHTPTELRPRDCLEKGHYSRWMATYCGHSNGQVEYAM